MSDGLVLLRKPLFATTSIKLKCQKCLKQVQSNLCLSQCQLCNNVVCVLCSKSLLDTLSDITPESAIIMCPICARRNVIVTTPSKVRYVVH
jgi:hypothetical protein